MSNWVDAVVAAWSRREDLHRADPETNCYRLFHGATDGVPGLFLDRYSDAVVVSVRKGVFSGAFPPFAPEAIRKFFLERTPIRRGFLKVTGADRSQGQSVSSMGETPWFGVPGATTLEGHELGLRYEIQLTSGFHTGLFLDQRHHRRWVKEAIGSRSLLNLFAHTCSFSVAAVAGGGRAVSVDTSGRYLEWGQRNFKRNQLPHERHQVFKADAGFFLERAYRRGDKFDFIVCDPPSFSRGPDGSVFRIEKNLEDMLASAARVIAPGGTLFVSTNYEPLGLELLRRFAESAFAKRQFEPCPLPKPEADFQGSEFSIHARAWRFA